MTQFSPIPRFPDQPVYTGGATTSAHVAQLPSLSDRPNIASSIESQNQMQATVGIAPKQNASHSALKAFCELAFLRIPAGALSIVTCAGAQAVSFGCGAILCGGLSVGTGLLWPVAVSNIDITVNLYRRAAKNAAWLGFRISEGAGSLMKYAAQSDKVGKKTEEISKKLSMISSVTGGVITSVPVATGLALPTAAFAAFVACGCPE